MSVALHAPPSEAAFAAPLPAAERPAPGEAAAAVRTVIQPSRGWQPINLRELWRHRELMYFLVWRDVKVRYKQTVFGAAWAVLQPLLLMVVFALFFHRMAGVSSGDLPYPLFAFAGFVPWTFFASAIAAGGNSVIGSERLITKIYFPRLAIPFAAAGAPAVDFLIAFGLLLVLMAGYGISFGPALALLPVVFGFILLAGLGVGTLLAALNVSYRDFRYVIPFLVQVWMFATPTVYMEPAGTSSGWLPILLNLNPLTGLIGTFRAAALGSPIPWLQFGVAALLAAGIFVAGCTYFRKVEDIFPDII
jgi:lipopolysaccharide transport system permease protein